MKRFNPMLIIWHVKELWKGYTISQKDLDNAEASPVEEGDNLKEAVLKLQKQLDELNTEV